MIRLTALLFLILAACRGDETLASYGGEGKVWLLRELDGAAFPARATLEFPGGGRIAGVAACGRYSAAMTVPYPWFQSGPPEMSLSSCPDPAAEDLAAQTAFVKALAAMEFAEISGPVLILSNSAGREMLFRAGG